MVLATRIRTISSVASLQTKNQVQASVNNVFSSQSYRRVDGSPTLPLEAVAIPEKVQIEIQKISSEQELTAKKIRKHSEQFQLVRASETLNQKRVPDYGKPTVRATPVYDLNQSISYAVTRFPATITSNIHVMAEVQRQVPHFTPTSLLDFGSGCGTSILAATTVFRDCSHVKLKHIAPIQSNDEASQVDDMDVETNNQKESILKHVKLVEKSQSMREIASRIINKHPSMDRSVNISQVSSLNDVSKMQTYDLVCASYSLNEVARELMVNPPSENEEVSRPQRENLAEVRIRNVIKKLWHLTSPGGVFVLVEDGTAAGFELVSLARDAILKIANRSKPKPKPKDDENFNEIEETNANSELLTAAHVLAPCLYSGKCPLEDSITRHRICRFVQRLNRPVFLRNAHPLPTGYEDEYFSYVAIQKVSMSTQNSDQSTMNRKWGRLIRNPLLKGRHVTLDVCTREGLLERRTVTKKNSPSSMYSKARHTKWGDVWAEEPSSKAQQVNF